VVPILEEAIRKSLPGPPPETWGGNQVVQITRATLPDPAGTPGKTIATFDIQIDVPPDNSYSKEEGRTWRLSNATYPPAEGDQKFKDDLNTALVDAGVDPAVTQAVTMELSPGSILVTVRGANTNLQAIEAVLPPGRCYYETDVVIESCSKGGGLANGMVIGDTWPVNPEINQTNYTDTTAIWASILSGFGTNPAFLSTLTTDIENSQEGVAVPIGFTVSSTAAATSQAAISEYPGQSPAPLVIQVSGNSGPTARAANLDETTQAGSQVALGFMFTGVIITSLFICFGKSVTQRVGKCMGGGKVGIQDLSKKPSKIAADPSLQCKNPDCKAACDPTWYRCRKCGKERPCIKCGTVYHEDSVFCHICAEPRPKEICINPGCGWEFLHDDSNFCRNCGYPRIDPPPVDPVVVEIEECVKMMASAAHSSDREMIDDVLYRARKLKLKPEDVPELAILLEHKKKLEVPPPSIGKLHLSFDGKKVKFSYGPKSGLPGPAGPPGPPPLPSRDDKPARRSIDMEEMSMSKSRAAAEPEFLVDVHPGKPPKRRRPSEAGSVLSFASWGNLNENEWERDSSDSDGVRTPVAEVAPEIMPAKTETAGTAAALSWAVMPPPEPYWDVDEEDPAPSPLPSSRLPIQLPTSGVPRSSSKPAPAKTSASPSGGSSPGWSQQAEFKWDDGAAQRMERRHSWSTGSTPQATSRRSRPGTPHRPGSSGSTGSLARSDSNASDAGCWSEQMESAWEQGEASVPSSARPTARGRPGSAPVLLGTAATVNTAMTAAAVAAAGQRPPDTGRRLEPSGAEEELLLEDMSTMGSPVHGESTLKPAVQVGLTEFEDTLRNNLPHSVPEGNFQWQQDRPPSSGDSWKSDQMEKWSDGDSQFGMQDKTLSPMGDVEPMSPTGTQPLRRALEYFDSGFEATPPNTVPEPHFQRGQSRASRDPNARRKPPAGLPQRPSSAPLSKLHRAAAGDAPPSPAGAEGQQPLQRSPASGPVSQSYWQEQLRKAQRARPSTAGRSRPSTPILGRPPLIPEEGKELSEMTLEEAFQKRSRAAAASSVTTMKMGDAMATMPMHQQYLEASGSQLTPRRQGLFPGPPVAGKKEAFLEHSDEGIVDDDDASDNWSKQDEGGWEDKAASAGRPRPTELEIAGEKSLAGTRAPETRDRPLTSWSDQMDTDWEARTPATQYTQPFAEDILPGAPMQAVSRPPRLPELPLSRNLGQRQGGAGMESWASSGATPSSASARSWKDAMTEGSTPYSRPVPLRVGDMAYKKQRTGDTSHRSDRTWSGQVEAGWDTDSGSATMKHSPSHTPQASAFTPRRMGHMPRPHGVPALSVDLGGRSASSSIGVPATPPPFDLQMFEEALLHQGHSGSLDLPDLDGRSFPTPSLGFQGLPGQMPLSPPANLSAGGGTAQGQSSHFGHGAPGLLPVSPAAASNVTMQSTMQSSQASWTREVEPNWDEPTAEPA